ncbi:bifunctional transcriptional activator/DNA repair enzyme AdaA [Paenibacillus flagellatus]|uniref:AraC family transcriptional regulator n=1 Tax=Paenibacillus flagellatus TaxID=2211139 RepID=A0A2V5L1G7_9BACL|nr:Ada metal-binding domain-containing protein [Paenibacillus flagellatus]PYI56566.1 AraC family transcriptional regulator [Paenibacillus flagellatus]
MNDEQWRAIVECDPAYDGVFYYGLSTTGIFCKPSCKSRTPKRDNVSVYPDNAAPLKDGLRPCKRCRPDAENGPTFEEELAERAARLVRERFREPLSLTAIADELYVSPFHLQKRFTKVMGMSPSKYLTLTRLEAAKSMLAETGDSVTAVALSCGFRSSAYFSAVFLKEIGMTPTAYRHRLSSPYGESLGRPI